MLNDEIEKLIREGYHRDYMCNRSTNLRDYKGEVSPPSEIRTIFGGPHFTGKSEEPRTVISEKQRKDRSRPQTLWTSSLPSSLEGK